MQVSLPLLAAILYRCLGYLQDILSIWHMHKLKLIFSSKIITFPNLEGDLLLYY